MLWVMKAKTNIMQSSPQMKREAFCKSFSCNPRRRGTLPLMGHGNNICRFILLKSIIHRSYKMIGICAESFSCRSLIFEQSCVPCSSEAQSPFPQLLPSVQQPLSWAYPPSLPLPSSSQCQHNAGQHHRHNHWDDHLSHLTATMSSLQRFLMRECLCNTMICNNLPQMLDLSLRCKQISIGSIQLRLQIGGLYHLNV